MAASRGLDNISGHGTRQIPDSSGRPLRIAFFGVDQVRDLEIKGEVRLEMLRIDSVLCETFRH